MTSSTETPQIALARVDGLLNKVYVVGLMLLLVDAVQNALRQVQYLNPIWLAFTLGPLIFAAIGAVFAAYRFGNTRYWYRALLGVVAFTLLTWAFQIENHHSLPTDFKPWIWWALGPVTMAAAGAWSRRWVYLAVIVAPLLWLVVATSQEGGGTPLALALQDSLYSFFFTTVVSVMVMTLRDRASAVDAANEKVIRATLDRTRADVLNRERAIFNSILHDKVLAALELASQATTKKMRVAASELADEAIGRLTREVDRTTTPPENVNLASIAEPFVDGIRRQFPDFVVVSSGISEIEIPFQVAAGIYEATILATKNSMTHAPGATNRKVRIRLSTKGLKVVVSDNGAGFRMSNVHKTALGVRWTMFRRLESIGVRASLESSPGLGTTWIFEWTA